MNRAVGLAGQINDYTKSTFQVTVSLNGKCPMDVSAHDDSRTNHRNPFV